MAAIDKFKAELIHREFQTLMSDFAKKHGLTAPRGGRTSWGADNIKLSCELKAVVDAGDGKTPQSAALIAYARSHGVDPSKSFHSNGKVFRLIDYNPSAHKTPWITEGVPLNGYGETKRYRHATSQIQRECKIIIPVAQAA